MDTVYIVQIFGGGMIIGHIITKWVYRYYYKLSV